MVVVGLIDSARGAVQQEGCTAEGKSTASPRLWIGRGACGCARARASGCFSVAVCSSPALTRRAKHARGRVERVVWVEKGGLRESKQEAWAEMDFVIAPDNFPIAHSSTPSDSLGRLILSSRLAPSPRRGSPSLAHVPHWPTSSPTLRSGPRALSTRPRQPCLPACLPICLPTAYLPRRPTARTGSVPCPSPPREEAVM